MRHPAFPRRSAATRRFSLGRPRSVRVAPDGSRVLFLRSTGPTDPVNRLYVLDVTTGEERLLAEPDPLLEAPSELGVGQETTEERARRERAREQAGGITSYVTDRAHERAVLVLAGRVFQVEVASGQIDELATVGPAFDARPDPTGSRVAYVSGGALHVTDVAGDARRLLADDDPAVTWGLAEFVAAEEMGRGRGFWWSPDGTRIAAARVDVSPVAVWHLADPANPDREPGRTRYPAAGTANADVSLTVVDLDGERVDVAWDREAFPYLVSVAWEVGAPLTLEVQTRDLRTVRFLVADESGATRTVLEQTDDAWVEPVAGTPSWLDGQRLVTVADVVGTADPLGTRRVLVDGQPVSPTGLQVSGVLAAHGDTVWFTASRDPLEQHVFRLDTRTQTLTAVTEEPGWHAAAVGGDVAVVSSATLEDPHVSLVVHRGRDRLVELRSVAEPAPLDPRPRYLELGERGLHGALLLPPDPGSGPLPVLLSPYGGPHAPPRAARTRHGLLEARWFADQGFAVLVVDGRGTPGRGPVWERAVYRDLATPVLDDQVDALHAAAAVEPRLDLGRVAIRGWSFGGFLAALAVLRRPDVFHAAIAGAPVTDWHLYDTYYTERYLGHPDHEPGAYRTSSLVDGASRLIDAAPAGDEPPRLLVIHGLSDDNVVVAHSLRLSAALLAAGRPHRFLPLSGVTHMTPQEVVAERLLHLQLEFLQEALSRAGGGG